MTPIPTRTVGEELVRALRASAAGWRTLADEREALPKSRTVDAGSFAAGFDRGQASGLRVAAQTIERLIAPKVVRDMLSDSLAAESADSLGGESR